MGNERSASWSPPRKADTGQGPLRVAQLSDLHISRPTQPRKGEQAFGSGTSGPVLVRLPGPPDGAGRSALLGRGAQGGNLGTSPPHQQRMRRVRPLAAAPGHRQGFGGSSGFQEEWQGCRTLWCRGGVSQASQRHLPTGWVGQGLSAPPAHCQLTDCSSHGVSGSSTCVVGRIPAGLHHYPAAAVGTAAKARLRPHGEVSCRDPVLTWVSQPCPGGAVEADTAAPR